MKIDKVKIRALIILAVVIGVSIASGIEFKKMHNPDKLYPSAYLTSTGKLSNYLDNLEGTGGNADVYYFDSGIPGSTLLLLGGTHPNEPAGALTAYVMLENIKVVAGRVILIPQACLSGFSCTDPMEGCPQFYTITSKSGERKFRFGSRVSNPLDQWPDPLVYSHYPSGQSLSGFETRNLNRAYPGRPDGSFTERVAYAIMQVIEKENVNIAIDLHEASPEAPIINALITHEKGRQIAASAVFFLEFENLEFNLELSPEKFRGLSHREWGDRTEVFPFLMETSNPIQGRLRGVTNEALITEGIDSEYKQITEASTFRVTYRLEGEPLERRVGRHMQGILALIEAYNELNPDNPILVSGLPGYSELMKKGVGNFLY